MVVIRVNCSLKAKDAQTITEGIHAQAASGVIVVPSFCDVFCDDKDGKGVEVYYQDERVRELEAKLAAALEYINAVKVCETCKHEMTQDASAECPADCEFCTGGACKGICKECYNGSKWEWRYAE